MLNKIKLLHFLGFTRDVKDENVFETSDMFEVDFCPGVNIFIGENGTGKTSILKVLYAWCKYDDNYIPSKTTNGLMFITNFIPLAEELKTIFNANPENLITCRHNKFHINIMENDVNFNITFDKISFQIKGDTKSRIQIPAIFIPTKEMLSHSNSFIPLYDKYKLPFDDTQVDIIKNAQLPETRELTPLAQKLLPVVSKVIDGEVVYENDTFYVVKNNGMKLEFSLEAEGLRKFGLLWKLIRNGLFDEPGTVLFWDGPEANLNPMLIPALVDVLLELQKKGVQMFISTHEYNFARYFDLKRGKKEDVIFHNLYKKENGYIYCDSSIVYQDLRDKAIEEAAGELGDFIIKKALEELGE